MFRIVGISLFCLSLMATAVRAQDFNEISLGQLEAQLNAELRTRLKEEKLYISVVVRLVEEEKLPRRLINTSFKYVRNKKWDSRYRFVYFVRVLQFQGRREGIAIPNFNFSIYSQSRFGGSAG